ncbi:MAG: Na(+)/H(+) antiporter subunit F [Firmicutes bacterium]|nr:Na(+)/H(+) antiporter subunit F [candidate division NPL-UPA2 bacterium]MBT9154439.1 Na(+)/H(+) antiporter subunit F [candidate division NPL-UPA2 bacterium]MBT9155407.1 Na(+)/H(+) antiporter subunit F [candidate division NPL-UPA2 bacterium]
MERTALLVTCLGLMLLTFASLYRAIVGPTPADRVVAINVIGTKTVVVLMLIGYIFQEVPYYLDVAMVYALISFLLTIGVARYIERGTIV